MALEEQAITIGNVGFFIAAIQFTIVGFLISLHFKDKNKMRNETRSTELLQRHHSELQHLDGNTPLDEDAAMVAGRGSTAELAGGEERRAGVENGWARKRR